MRSSAVICGSAAVAMTLEIPCSERSVFAAALSYADDAAINALLYIAVDFEVSLNSSRISLKAASPILSAQRRKNALLQRSDPTRRIVHSGANFCAEVGPGSESYCLPLGTCHAPMP